MPGPSMLSTPVAIALPNSRDNETKAAALSPSSWPRQGLSPGSEDRRRDCFERLQRMMDANERRERSEHEAMLKALPRLRLFRSAETPLSSILVKPDTKATALDQPSLQAMRAPTPDRTEGPSPPRRSRSVRFAAGPPTVFQRARSAHIKRQEQ